MFAARSFAKTCLIFIREDDGTTSVEYAVMVAAILMGVIVTIGTVGAASGGLWGKSKNELQAVGF